MDIESLEAANQSLQADLKLAFKRIGDLQAAIEDEMESDDNEDLINRYKDELGLELLVVPQGGGLNMKQSIRKSLTARNICTPLRNNGMSRQTLFTIFTVCNTVNQTLSTYKLLLVVIVKTVRLLPLITKSLITSRSFGTVFS